MPFVDIIDRASGLVLVLEATKDEYLIHKELIVKESAFVKSCDWNDKQSMHLMTNWLYVGFKPIRDQLPDVILSLDNYRTELVNLYMLADRLLMLNLKNEVLDEYRSKMSYIKPDITVLQNLDSECPEPCQLKIMMLDDVAERVAHMPTTKGTSKFLPAPQWFQDFADLVDNDNKLAFDATKIVFAHWRLSKQPEVNMEQCHYHDHEKGTVKCDGSVAD